MLQVQVQQPSPPSRRSCDKLTWRHSSYRAQNKYQRPHSAVARAVLPMPYDQTAVLIHLLQGGYTKCRDRCYCFCVPRGSIRNCLAHSSAHATNAGTRSLTAAFTFTSHFSLPPTTLHACTFLLLSLPRCTRFDKGLGSSPFIDLPLRLLFGLAFPIHCQCLVNLNTLIPFRVPAPPNLVISLSSPLHLLHVSHLEHSLNTYFSPFAVRGL